MSILKASLLALFFSVSAQANATVVTFGSLLAGTYTPSSNFATLSYTETGNVYTFTLQANNLNALFTNGAFIGSLAVDTTPDVKLSGKNADTVTISNVSGGVSTVGTTNGGGPTGVWDFRFDYGQGSDRLTANESVTWTATFSKSVTFAGLSLHVQGLTGPQGGSAWYVPSVTVPVPEPENAALLFLGLGVVAAGLRKQRAQ